MRGLEQRLRERGVREGAGALDSGASEVRRGVEVPPTSPGDELDLEGLEAEAPDEMVEIGMGIYVMSLVGRSKRRTLHQVGSCYRRPGLDYKDYVVIGDQRPELKAGERLCGSCFGAKDKAASEAASEEEEVVVSDESSSSEFLSSDPDEGQSDLEI